MSVIVRCPDGILRVYMKGADSIVREKITINKELIEVTDGLMLNFARDGLRTLMIAYKELSQNDYEAWDKEYIVKDN
jgi:phospholipid-transporting ATPase